jgi:hypothetical protein
VRTFALSDARSWNWGLRTVVITVLHLMVAAPLPAQDLDPRAYANIPVNSTLLVGGFSVSRGGVVSDPTLPDLDQHATVETPSLGVGRSFSLFGQTAQAFGALPYSWAQGSVLGGTVTATRAASPTCASVFECWCEARRPPLCPSSQSRRAGPFSAPA